MAPATATATTPVTVATSAMTTPPHNICATTQRAYAATILSFMGAIHWGLEMAASMNATSISTPLLPRVHALAYSPLPSRYVVAVMPSLVACGALLTPDLRQGLLVEGASLAALLVYDVWSWRRGRVPRWYPSLRVWLTAGACGSMLMTKVEEHY